MLQIIKISLLTGNVLSLLSPCVKQMEINSITCNRLTTFFKVGSVWGFFQRFANKKCSNFTGRKSVFFLFVLIFLIGIQVGFLGVSPKGVFHF